MEQRFNPVEYANDYLHGKTTPETVRNWIKKWKLGTMALPPGHRLESLPNGRAIIVVGSNIAKPKYSPLVEKMLQARAA